MNKYDVIYLNMQRFLIRANNQEVTEYLERVVIVELKYDKTADLAIRQIKGKQCTQVLEGYSCEVLLVGMNYDKKNKSHNCVIEKWNR